MQRSLAESVVPESIMPYTVASDPLTALRSHVGQPRPDQAEKADFGLAVFAEALSARLRGAQPDEASAAAARAAGAAAGLAAGTEVGSPLVGGGGDAILAALAHLQGMESKKTAALQAASAVLVDGPTQLTAQRASTGDGRKGEAANTGEADAPPIEAGRAVIDPAWVLSCCGPMGLALGYPPGRASADTLGRESGDADPTRTGGVPLAGLSGDVPRAGRGRILPAAAAEVAADGTARHVRGEAGRGPTAHLEAGVSPQAGAESLPKPVAERLAPSEPARPPMPSERIPGAPGGTDPASLLAGPNVRPTPGEWSLSARVTTTLATPFGQPQWGSELGEKLVWLAGRHGHVADLQLNPPSLGSLEVRLSINGNEAGAQFYSANAAVREAIEAALPRLREMLASSGLTLGGASVSGESFRSGASFAQDGQGRGNRDDGDPSPFVEREIAPAPRRIVSGLVDLYA